MAGPIAVMCNCKRASLEMTSDTERVYVAVTGRKRTLV